MGIFYGPGVTGGSQNVDNTSTELGMKFHASVNGTISGIRFYKTGTDVLNYTGSIWLNGNTTALATGAYTSDNTNGWKQIDFASPVSITAGTTYIVSYFSPSPGYYAYTANGLAAPFTNSLLTAESSCYNQPGTGYPASPSVAKYWVDPVFTSATAISVFNLTDISSAVVVQIPVTR
ncbi:MAG: DUF4082 domain-containing protein [Chitinophagaceae bacterium]|nr:DUF4082 domain-containing protein [Chitinophagaceae bacterium]